MCYARRSIVLLLVPTIFLAAGYQRYTSPTVKEVSNAYKPYSFLQDGFFVMGVKLDMRGNLYGIESWRDPGGMMPVAMNSVRGWTFGPGIENGDFTDSVLPVIFVYRPTTYLAANTSPPSNFRDLMHYPDSSNASSFTPPKLLKVAYPQYPVNSVQGASVIMQVTISAGGTISNAQFLRKTEPFTKFAYSALKAWRFEPATFRGAPISSDVIVAFVFQPPPVTGGD